MSGEPPFRPELTQEQIRELRERISEAEDRLIALRDELAWWEAGATIYGQDPALPVRHGTEGK